MKLKTPIVALATITSCHAATSIGIANNSGRTAGVPIVDNAGIPIAIADSKFEVGTFTDGFAETLGSLNIDEDDQVVIDAFTASGSAAPFSRPGLFGAIIDDTDPDGSLGAASAPLFVMVTYSPEGAGPEVMVFDFNLLYPEQVETLGSLPGQNIERENALSLIVFGNNENLISDVDTSVLPPALQTEVYSQGITFNAVPEPSTGILAALAALGLVGRRRR